VVPVAAREKAKVAATAALVAEKERAKAGVKVVPVAAREKAVTETATTCHPVGSP